MVISLKKIPLLFFKPYSMTHTSGSDIEGFVASGRTGRRNALPDIMDETVVKTSVSGLPDELGKLQFSESECKYDHILYSQ